MRPRKGKGKGATPIDINDLITQAEAAKLRGVALSSIDSLVSRGRLRYVEMFGKRLVYRSEVLAFERMKTGPKPKAAKKGGKKRVKILK